MKRWLLAGYLGLTAFVLAILVIPLGIVAARGERDRLMAAVERDATVLAGLAEDALDQGMPADLQGIVDRYQSRTGGRVVIADREGVSVADSDMDPGRDYSTRPEFERALAGDVAVGSRYSETLSESFLYVALPVASGGRVHGAVRVTFPTASADARIRRTWSGLALVSAVVLGAATVLSVLLARTMVRPVTRLTEGTRSMAEGGGAVRVEPAGPRELRELAASFNVMSAQLADLLSSQATFVADASHQLRSPLAALRLRLENLEQAIDPRASPELDGAIAETMRLSRLVGGLLALTRADTAAVPVTDVQVAEVMEDRRRTWSPLAEEHDIELVTETEPVAVRISEGALEQILDNLIANALNASPAGTRILISAAHSGHQVVVHVKDQGPGMSDADRERAFDRFWRGAPSTNREGFGLGLAIVHRLVDNSGGTITLAASEDGGLDVTLRWPAQATGDAPEPAAADQTRTGISR